MEMEKKELISKKDGFEESDEGNFKEPLVKFYYDEEKVIEFANNSEYQKNGNYKGVKNYFMKEKNRSKSNKIIKKLIDPDSATYLYYQHKVSRCTCFQKNLKLKAFVVTPKFTMISYRLSIDQVDWQIFEASLRFHLLFIMKMKRSQLRILEISGNQNTVNLFLKSYPFLPPLKSFLTDNKRRVILVSALSGGVIGTIIFPIVGTIIGIILGSSFGGLYLMNKRKKHIKPK